MNRLVALFLTGWFILGAACGSALSANDLSMDTFDPSHLYLGWWKNFEDEKENEGNIGKLIQELKGLQAQLDPQKHPLTLVQIDQVILSAEQVQKARQEKLVYQQVHPFYLTHYSLNDLLEVSDRIQTLRNEISKTDQQTRSIQQNIDRLRNEMDYLQVEYPLKEEESAERLTLGLQIMNLRFMIAANELQIKKLQKLSNYQEDNLVKLQKEMEVAEERLDMSGVQEKESEKRIQATEALLVEANRSLLQSRGTSALDSPAEMASTIKVLQIKAQLLFEKIQLLFVKMAHEKPKGEIMDELVNYNQQVKLLKTSANNLKAQMEGVPLTPEVQSTFTAMQNKLSNVQLLTSLLNEKVVEEQTSFAQRLYWIYFMGIEILSRILSYSTVNLFRINDYSVTLWVLFRALCILLGAVFLSKLSLEFLKNFDRFNTRFGNANTYILSKILYYLTFTIGVLIALYSIGFTIGNFIIIAGALGVGVGFGLQSIANNFFSGLVVLFSKMLKVGDVIETSTGVRGFVKAIKMQNIHIRTYDGKDVILPNADLVTKNVINWTMVDPFIRLHIPFSVGYGSDKDLVEKLVIDIANNLEYTVKNESICPKPAVWLIGLGDNGLNLELIVWVNIKKHTSIGNLETEYLWEIERELIKNGIEIPFPKTDIRILKSH